MDLKTGGGTSYPTSKDTVTLASSGETATSEEFNGPAQAIVAIENELGTGLKGVVADLATRLAINIATDGGFLRGSSFPSTPPAVPHAFWRTDLEKFYLYDTTLSQYSELATSISLADYVSKTSGTTITAQHQFNPGSAGVPFTLGSNAQNQRVTGATADKVWDGTALRSPATASTANTLALRDSNGYLTAKQLVSDISTGTAPLVVTSTTEVANLKATTATTANNLAMTGEASANNASQVNLSGGFNTIATLNIGSVTAGDRIVLMGTVIYVTGNQTGTNSVLVSKGGSDTATAYISLYHVAAREEFYATNAMTAYKQIMAVFQIAGSGTFNPILQVSTQGTGGYVPQYNGQIYAFFLKKQ